MRRQPSSTTPRQPTPPRGNAAVQYRSLTRATQPAVEPVTLSEAKAHCRIDGNDDDAYVASLITAAREWCEQYLDRSLVYTQWVMRFDRFPPDGTHDIELPRPPMAAAGTATAVALTFTYDNGTTATYATSSYRVDRNSTPGTVKTSPAG
ncbi:MAG: phage gp6-like head-tail connector protein [Betaproteobacteria bacterium]|nr:phage gp6-like head-tail connector protein [Betaproteobacteria bacterium]